MKTRMTIISLGVFVTIAAVAAIAESMPKMRYTVHVVDEEGHPVQGVNAVSLFNKSAVDFGQKVEVKQTTDANGNFTAEGYSDDGVPAGQLLSKANYYKSGMNIPTLYDFAGGHWLPWDKTYTTVLRKIGSPIPMHARIMGAKIPSESIACGYDLEVGDWVAPYGNGLTTDFIVTLINRTYKSYTDYDVRLKISFPNPGDGLRDAELRKEFANSEFIWPRFAPEDGYQSNFEARHLFHMAPNQPPQSVNTANENQAYFIRVRTLLKDGKIVSALYGKIKGGIFIGPDDANTASVGFIYFLNPIPNDRNMEFDPERNLSKNLKENDQRLNQP